MNRCVALVLVVLSSACFADTFVHQQSGKRFNGYIVGRRSGGKTKVHVENKSPQYLDLRSYTIQQNDLGRKNKVFIFPIKDSIGLICETEAFEKAISSAASQGPLFILIEIDTPGGRVDLGKRICRAIMKTDNCRTVAFVSGGKVGGAFSAGAIVALACDKIYVHEGTAIGAATLYARGASAPEALEKVYGLRLSAKLQSAWTAYCAAIAERNNRPGLLVIAMTDKNIEVTEIIENDKHVFITPDDKMPLEAVVVRTWSKKGSLLTLTAEEAVQSGIADKVVASREEVFADLDAVRANEIHDIRISRARRRFERGKRKFDKILSSISSLEEQVVSLAKDVNAVEGEFRRANRVTYFDWNWGMISRLDTIMVDRDRLLNQSLDVLSDLIREYNRALPLAKKYPDLNRYVSTLEKSLESTETTYGAVLFRLNFGY